MRYSCCKIGVSRRYFCSGLLAFFSIPSAAAFAQRQSQQSSEIEDFLRLSEMLTDRTQLPRSTAAAYFYNIQTNPIVGPILRQVLGGGSVTDENMLLLNSNIISQWYTGIMITSDGPEVETYTNALLWNAMDDVGPIGTCMTVMGTWSEAPAQYIVRGRID